MIGRQNDKNQSKKIIAVTAIVLMSVFTLVACGSSGGSSDSQAKTTILFASDYQEQEDGGAPKDNLTDIIRAVGSDGKIIDEVIICGDYTNDRVRLSPEESISEIEDVVNAECSGLGADNILFVQGNHDQLTESISASGLHEFKDYLVYVVNTEEDFPWMQGKTAGSLDKVRNTAEEMEICFDELTEKGEDRPIIVAGHVPLHFSGRTSSVHATGDNLYSSLVFNAVNDAAKSLDIIYIFGHNHSKAWDCYLGQGCVYLAAGDNILIPEYTEGELTSDKYTAENLNFTYMNAGYIGYCVDCGAADNTLTVTVCEIYNDKISLMRYSEDGVYPLGSAGCASTYYDDSNLIPDKYYSKKTDSRN